MFRRNRAATTSTFSSRLHLADDQLSSCRYFTALWTWTTLLLIAIMSHLVTVCGHTTTTTDSPDKAGPFHSRGRMSSNFVGGYLAAIERQHRRFSTDVDILRRRLGEDFNPDLMSVDKPSLNQTRTDAVTVSSSLYNHLQDIDFTHVIAGARRPLKPSVRKYIEKWLLERAACRLRPSWTDLGPLFWPRWVRRGSCGDEDDALLAHRRRRGRPRNEAASCSWPPGMHCVPEASQTVRLLRWHCTASSRRQRIDNEGSGREARSKSRRRRGRGRSRRRVLRDTADKYRESSLAGMSWRWRCRWKKVPYAVTTACFCSC